MSFRVTTSAPAQKLTDDNPTKPPQNTVTAVYQTQIGGYWRNVTVLWTKTTVNLAVDSVGSGLHQDCKIDIKPWCFWAKKGYKKLEVDTCQIDVYWDLRSAKFLGSPEPVSEFYVALIHNEEVVLLIGDLQHKVYKKKNTKPCNIEGALFFKKENVYGKKSFLTRAKFDPNQKDFEIVVESLISDEKDPEMWISIDGIVLVHVKNLQWKFRGNQIVLINKQPIEVFWDVHTWLFSNPSSNHGLFIFKSSPGESDNDREDDIQSQSGTEDSDCSVATKYCSTNSQFCLFLCAWKIE